MEKMKGLHGVAIGPLAAIVRANLRKTGPDAAPPGAVPVRPLIHEDDVQMFITPAFAQAAAGGDTNSMLMSLLPFALIFVIMYFLILRPQQKKVKDHAELVKNIRRGDTVVTSGGLVGKVTKVVDDDQIEFEISDGVRVRQMRQMISGVRAKGEPAKEKSESAKDETAAS
jgi:preprotein translocase subunit YajC